MKSQSIFALLPISFGLLVGGAGQAMADLITNGSFEDPVLAAGTALDVLGGDSTSIPGWTVLGINVLLIQTTYTDPPVFNSGIVQYNAQDGLNSVDLTGGGNSGPTDGIQQTVATTPGQTYDLSFYVGRTQSDNGNVHNQGPATADLSINGGASVGFTNANAVPAGYVGWEGFSVLLTAPTSSTTITFMNGNPEGPTETDFAGLDNVSMVATPEPSSILLMGLGALAAVARRRMPARAA